MLKSTSGHETFINNSCTTRKFMKDILIEHFSEACKYRDLKSI